MRASATASLLIISQAPGTRVHASGVPWQDDSGDRLRGWLGLSPEAFHDPARVAIMPMGLCYPGKVPGGGDSPPRPECAPLWHARLRAALPAVRLTLLVGMYAQRAYLPQRRLLADAVRGAAAGDPALFALPHPSWRSIGWMRRNPWFEVEVLPVLRQRVAAALAMPPR